MVHLSLSEFDKAAALINRAVKAGEVSPDAAAFEKTCDDYVEFWKTEQSLRAAEANANDLPRVLFKTNKGEIVLELFENEAPNTVANFISLVEAKKYNGVKFHRV
ncbi:MAG: peptidylprolyl isomerase, partial [Planctomycetia bacterium]|nr:peptidylprolyl isomerase [Planctomycetia bacterium]